MRAGPPSIKKTVRTNRKAAEALRLEIQQFARRLGISAEVRMRRMSDAGPGQTAPPPSAARRRRRAPLVARASSGTIPTAAASTRAAR